MTAWRLSLVGFALAAAVLVGIGWAALSRIAALSDADAAVVHTMQVRASAAGLLSLLKDAETGQRGFVIMQTPEYLEPYTAAIAGIPGRIREFRGLTADNPVQQANIATLEGLIDRRLAMLAEVLTALRAGGLPAATGRLQQNEGKRVMDAAREVVAQILAEEDRLLAQRSAEQQARARCSSRSD